MGKLYLKAFGGPFTENLFDEIEALTSGAELDVDLIEYDEESRHVVIPIIRFPIIPGQKKSFRKVTQYKQDKHQKIPCVVTIRNVTDSTVETHFEEGWERRVMLLFGIGVKGKRIFLYSVQETRGKHLFGLSIETDSLDVEIRDV